MMILIFVVIIAAIYLIWRSNGSQTPNFTPKNDVQSMTDSELETELAKRKNNAHLEAEVADLKKQLSELKNKEN